MERFSWLSPQWQNGGRAPAITPFQNNTQFRRKGQAVKGLLLSQDPALSESPQNFTSLLTGQAESHSHSWRPISQLKRRLSPGTESQYTLQPHIPNRQNRRPVWWGKLEVCDRDCHAIGRCHPKLDTSPFLCSPAGQHLPCPSPATANRLGSLGDAGCRAQNL